MNSNKALFFSFTLFKFLFWVKSQKQLDSLFSRLLVMRSEGKLNESLVVCKELISGYEQLKDEEKALKLLYCSQCIQ
jgi:hypothetical protein